MATVLTLPTQDEAREELKVFQSDRPGYIAKEREKEADKNAKGQAK